MAGSEEVARKLFERRHRMIAGLLALGQNVGAQMEAAGKRKPENGGAPWKDRTGHARQGLTHDAILLDEKIRVRYAHTMEYGVQLEKAHSGKYAELEPRAKEFAPLFYEEAERIVKST
jgi:hypothetical protein